MTRLLRAGLAGIALALLALLAPATGLALERTNGAPTVTVITTGLQVPWDIAFLPDGRALVTERTGTVRLVAANGALSPTPVATLNVSQNGEGGLLGIALDPAFTAGSPFVYLTATIGTEMQVQRWRWTGAAMTFDGVVIQGITMGTIHSSGRVRFGPDGAMYVGAGDAGNGANSQNTSVLNGKILRVAPGGFRGGPVTPQIHALGVRNPQGFAWQPGSGRFYSTEHGPSGFDGPSGDDELDLIVPGGNYGWPYERGADQSPYLSPVHLWPTTIAPSGLSFVTLPGSSWTGKAIVAGLKGQVLRLLTFNGAAVVDDQPLLLNAFGRLRAVTEAPDGSIWVTTSNRDGRGTPVAGDDRILRIVPPADGVPPAPPSFGSDPSAPQPLPHTPTPRSRPGAGILTLNAPKTVTAHARAQVVVIFDRTPAGPVALQARRGGHWHTLRLTRPTNPLVRFAFRPARAGVQVLRIRYRVAGRGVGRSLRLTVTG
ncbi:MAG TPA: PQQ-dependent sugar dehydrogenase [Miltoncostaea sp.]|nr:PQQ-dependent sugar dehydrogenase [Miltoncostaea sp.]